jgi:hypothetical protein
MISKQNQAVFTQTFKGSFGYLWKKMNAKNQFNITEITYASQAVTPLYQNKLMLMPPLEK